MLVKIDEMGRKALFIKKNYIYLIIASYIDRDSQFLLFRKIPTARFP
jgi:hypothetical protein